MHRIRSLTLGFSTRPGRLGLTLGLALACSTAEPSVTPGPTESEAPERPHVGDRAPAISLAMLAGPRVELPQSNADRAAVVIFGSFS